MLKASLINGVCLNHDVFVMSVLHMHELISLVLSELFSRSRLSESPCDRTEGSKRKFLSCSVVKLNRTGQNSGLGGHLAGME